MMKISSALLLLAFLIICDAAKINNNKKNASLGLGVHAASVDASSLDFPWIVNIFEITPNQDVRRKLLGPGVIISKSYVLCHAAVIVQIGIAENLRIVSKSNVMGSLNGRNIVVRHLVDVIINLDSHEGFYIGLIKFTSRVNEGLYAPMPQITQNYDIATEVNLYNFGDNFFTATKSIGPESDCTTYGYNTQNTFCVEDDSGMPVKYKYPGTIAIINGKYAGFCIGSGKIGGESYIDIRKFLPWIKQNAVE